VGITPEQIARALAMLQEWKDDANNLHQRPTFMPDYDDGYEVGLVDGARQILSILGLLKEEPHA
jgi:hypothetical protein